MAIVFYPRPFDKLRPYVRRPTFKSALGASSPPPQPESPLKVWDGTTWQPAGIKIET